MSALPSFVNNTFLLIFGTAKERGSNSFGGYSPFNAWLFFSKRFDFLWENFSKTTSSVFKFRVFQHTVVALRGVQARKSFFNDRNLTISDGYDILMGPTPLLKDVSEELRTDRNVTEFNKRVLLLINNTRLFDLFPRIMESMDNQMIGWGAGGRLDPFEDIYDLVVHMTIRMTTCNELADSNDDIFILQRYFGEMHRNVTPTSMLLPWFPSIAKKKKESATTALYTILKKYVEMRRKAETPSADAIDVLLSNGQPENEIIGFILSIVGSGVIYPGVTACWSLIYLAFYPEWMDKVKGEINRLIVSHADSTSSVPRYEKLSTIPIAVWETELPILDVVIRETIRIVVNGTALRRNLLNEMEIDGQRVANGDFVAYSIYDSHMNPEIYTSPAEFDPERYEIGREEDKKSTYAFLGWGVGRHPCSGAKIAKLELKFILAMFLSMYEYEVVDGSGSSLNTIPRPDYNDIHKVKPVGEPCFFQYKRKSG